MWTLHMKIRFTSLKPILDLFDYNRELSAAQITEKTWLWRTIVHKYLKELIEQGKIEKKWTVPKVIYFNPKWINKKLLSCVEDSFLIPFNGSIESSILDYETRIILDWVFLKFSPLGKTMNGISGIIQWCEERKLNVRDKIQEYLKIYKYIKSKQDECWLLSADDAFWKDFQEKFLDRVYYADQYKYMDFGRWKLAELTFYAKQSQNKKLISESIAEIFPKLECNIYREKYDAIAITPWSIKRQNQLLGALKKELEIFQLPFINIIKYSESWIFIPQKSLKSRNERIENAKNTIFVDDKHAWDYKKVLLIDDFVGSGATLNETAKKLKDEWVEQVIGFAFVGNTNLSYEVINEI